jgi:cytochrome P450
MPEPGPVLTRFEEASAALREPRLAQALYDEGKVVMDRVLLTLHGEEHRARRLLEFRVFRRDFFRYYEQEVFPRTLGETLAPCLDDGRLDLVQFGYRVTVNLTADFAGIDRPGKSAAETQALLALIKTFSEGATLVHSRRDRDAVRTEVRAALAEFERRFFDASVARRERLIAQHARGEIAEDALPRDVLTVLLRNEDRVELPRDVLVREMAFYLQAGAHSTANSTTHALHEIFEWRRGHPDDAARLERDPLFVQRCVHESLRLHPASPVAWRRAQCPVHVAGAEVAAGSRVVIDMAAANRDPAVFGPDADRYNPHRAVPPGHFLFGLTFGTGVHACLGRDLDGGLVPRADTDPAEHQYGIVTLLVRTLLGHGAEPDPERPPVPDANTERPNFGSYPVILTRRPAPHG